MYAPQSTAALRPAKSTKHLKRKPDLPKTSTSLESSKNEKISSIPQTVKQAKIKRSWLGLRKKESEVTTPDTSLLSSDVNTTNKYPLLEPLTSNHLNNKMDQSGHEKKTNDATSKEVAAYVNKIANTDITHYTNGLMKPADPQDPDFGTLFLRPDEIEQFEKSRASNQGPPHNPDDYEQYPQTPPGGDGYNRFWINGRYVFAFDNNSVITDYDQDRASDWGQEAYSPKYNIEPTIKPDKGKARVVSADFTPDRREVAQTSRFEENKNKIHVVESKIHRSTLNLDLYATDQAISSNPRAQNSHTHKNHYTPTQASSKRKDPRLEALFQEPTMQVQDDFNPTGVIHKTFFDPSIDAMVKKYPEASMDLGVLRVLCSSLAAQLEYDATKGLKRRHNRIEKRFARLLEEAPEKLAVYYMNKWAEEDPDQYQEINSMFLRYIATGLLEEIPDKFMKYIGNDIMEEINTLALENPDKFVKHFGKDFMEGIQGIQRMHADKDVEIAKLRSLIKDKDNLMDEYGDKISQREDELDESNSYATTLNESKVWLEARVTSLAAEKERFASQLKQSGERFRREQKEHDQLVLYLERENNKAIGECRIAEEKLAQEKERAHAQQLHIQALELRLGINVSLISFAFLLRLNCILTS